MDVVIVRTGVGWRWFGWFVKNLKEGRRCIICFISLGRGYVEMGSC